MTNKQQRLLNLIIKYNKACEKLGVSYSLACGTALGAIREKGFIPWDDDLDIMMRLSDYNIMDKQYHMFTDEFKWVSQTSVSDSPVVLARIYEKDVDFCNLENYPYIDIHIYCGCPTDKNKIIRSLKISDIAGKIFWVKKRKYRHIFKRKKSLIGALCKIPLVFIPTSVCSNVIYKYANKWPYNYSDLVMPIQGYYGIKEVLPRLWLEHYQYVDFNGNLLPIISYYHEYLTKLYGDYMTPVRYSH